MIGRVETVDVAVIGGGAIGLAAARAIAAPDRTVCLLERRPRPGMETSTHNSGVIHAGIYYPAGSLKARLCVSGMQQLYEYCARRGVPHRRIGKLIVADASQESQLPVLLGRGQTNGVPGLELVDASFTRKREPHIRPMAALYSPNTGIVEAEALVRALADDCTDRSVMVLPATNIEAGDRRGHVFELKTAREAFQARVVVNAAGLYADDVSKLFGGERFRIYPSRGEYAEVARSKRDLVNGLVYPMPGVGGHLGLHFTKNTNGDLLLGPTARYDTGKEDYESDRWPAEAFLEHALHLLPDLTRDDLRQAGTGIRAKLNPPDQDFADFMIRADAKHPALIHLAGIDSPGLTSCLAIGEMAAGLVGDALR